MSAEESRHEDAPKKIEERVVSGERHTWTQMPECEENAAFAQEQLRVADLSFGIASGGLAETDEIRDRLLFAIGDTEIARLMKDMTPADGPQPHAPGSTEAPKIPISVVANFQPSAELAQEPPAAGPAPAPAVRSSAATESMPLAAPAAPLPRHPAPPEPDSILEEAEALRRLSRMVGAAGHPGGEIASGHPHIGHLVQTSPEVSGPLMPPPKTPLLQPLSAPPNATEAAASAGVPHVSSLSRQPESGPAVATPPQISPAPDRSPGTTMARRNEQIDRPHAKPAPAMDSAPATNSMARTTAQSSVRAENWLLTTVVPAMVRLWRSICDLSIQFWNLAEAQPALTRESMGQTSRRAPETRMEKWFDPRRSLRWAKPPAVAYCWTADSPDPIQIADISASGAHLVTNVRWPVGGMLSMTLERTDMPRQAPASWIVIHFIVVRLCKDGVAGAFIPSTHRLSPFVPGHAENCVDDKTLKRFVRQLAANIP